MKKRILFICNKKSGFLSIKIKTYLQEEGFDVVLSSFVIDEVNELKDKPQLILLSFEGIEDKDKQFLRYLNDLCVEEEKRVYLCGYKNDIQDVSALFQSGIIIGSFKRPFEVADLVSTMNKEMDKFSKDEGKKHILVVDDSGDMLRAIKGWLSDTYHISIVNSGTNAILFLANHKPDLILLDYEMPLCTGAQIMEMIRAETNTRTIPIMFLTGKSDMESVRKVLSLKPEGYMLKSASPEEIKETINKFFMALKTKDYDKGN